MAFILNNDGRDENVIIAFENYRNYIESNKTKLPSSVYNLAISDWFYNSFDHKCPHDAWLENLVISEPSEGSTNEIRKTEITVKLLGAYHDGYIELIYKNVTSFKIDAFNVKSGHSDWRYDEFRLSDAGLVLHEIEWCGIKGASNWLIEAENIEYIWSEKNT